MTDLLREFEEPAVMDIKVGTRTYLEEELKKKDLRPVSTDIHVRFIYVYSSLGFLALYGHFNCVVPSQVCRYLCAMGQMI